MNEWGRAALEVRWQGGNMLENQEGSWRRSRVLADCNRMSFLKPFQTRVGNRPHFQCWQQRSIVQGKALDSRRKKSLRRIQVTKWEVRSHARWAEHGAESSQTPKSSLWDRRGPWRDLPSLFLSFLFCEMGIIITPTSWACQENWVRYGM